MELDLEVDLEVELDLEGLSPYALTVSVMNNEYRCKNKPYKIRWPYYRHATDTRLFSIFVRVFHVLIAVGM